MALRTSGYCRRRTAHPEEVLTSAKDQLDGEEISLADNEEILHALSELTPVFELFDREGRLYRWHTEDKLVEVTAKLP